MRSWVRDNLVVSLALLWVIICNLLIIGGVALNRAGEPLAEITLTENELRMPTWDRMHGENSAVILGLAWENRLGLQLPNQVPRYIDREDLKQLGFDVSRATDTERGRRFYERALPREVVMAFFFNAEAPESERSNYSFRPGPPSRLHLIDLASDAETLRQRYPDLADELLLLKGNVRIAIGGDEQIYGRVQSPKITEITVPSAFHDALEQAGGKYSIRLATGRNLVPWIRSVEPR